MKFINHYWIASTSSILLLFTLVLSLQGFDLTDEGFVLVAYQNFFDDPQYASHMFGTYLTAFVGGVWEKLFGWGGWYSFRVLDAFIIVWSYVLICYMLKDYWKYKWLIFLSFFVVVLNMNVEHGTLVFHYYTFSAFMNCLVGFLLFCSYKSDSNWLLFLSSLLLGINVFVRIPNITLCAIPYLLSLICYYYSRDIKAIIWQIVVISCGIIIGWGLMISFMVLNGHLDMFADSILTLGKTAQSSTSNHGVIPMLMTTYINMKYILCYVLTLLLFFAVTLYSTKRLIQKASVVKFFFLLILSVVLLLLLLMLQDIYHPYFPRTTLLIAFAYVLFVGVLWKRYKDRNLIYIMVLFFLISNLQPLGSDSGIGNMGPYAIWGLVPVSVVLFVNTYGQDRQLYRNVVIVIVGVFLLHTIIVFGNTVCRTCYRDKGERIKKTYRIRNSSLATVLTSFEQGEEIDALLRECKKYFSKGDTVLMALDMPGMHYLTKTKAYLRTPWPMLLREINIDGADRELTDKIVIVERTPDMSSASTMRNYANIYRVHEYIEKERLVLGWQSDNYKIWYKENRDE